MRFKNLSFALTLAAASAGSAAAQENAVDGLDVSLGLLGNVDSLSHIGTFPHGQAAFAMSTTSCNLGSVDVPWLAAMNEDHPFIAFLIVRESDGRMTQISNRSFVKHGFFALSSSQCIPCQNPSGGSFLGVGCSDTYGVGTNGDNFWLGPADEIDPWLGTWDSTCSHFDMGQPPVSAPFDCDGNRNSINPPNSLGNRVHVRDADLNVPGATFYYQAQYVVRAEPEDNRKNNLGSRRFTPFWAGSNWNLSVPSSISGNQLTYGSVLGRWAGASVTSNTNNGDDGRIYVATKTEDLGDGMYHYEYAVHNRDNRRGVGSFRIPVCPGASVFNVGFHDIDDDPTNDWASTKTTTELAFSSPDNPIGWNTIYNFWFDSDVAPSSVHSVVTEAFDAGIGADKMSYATIAPMGPNAGFNLGSSTVGSSGVAPELRACGGFSSGETGHLVLRQAEAGTAALLVAGLESNPTSLLDGTLIPFPVLTALPLTTDAEGSVDLVVPGGGGPVDIYLQYLCADDGVPSGYAFSNALRVNFGS